MPSTLQTMIFCYNYKSNDVFIHLIHYNVYLQFKKFEIEMNSLGNILYLCTLLHIICKHLHDLYNLDSLSGWKGLTKFIPKDWLNSTLWLYTTSYWPMVLQFAKKNLKILECRNYNCCTCSQPKRMLSCITRADALSLKCIFIRDI